MPDLSTLIRALPKAELHIHLEGSLEPELMLALAERNDVAIPYQTVEDLRAAYSFTRLQDFLDIYYAGASVLQTTEDFHDLVFAYMQRAVADGARHVEAFFDPQTDTDRGVPVSVVIEGVTAGLDRSREELGVTSKLILCFLRHLSEEAAFDTLRAAEPHLDKICGVGLDSSEVGHPPSKFARVFDAARGHGLKCVAHAGEEGPPAYVWEALDILKVDRVDHGNRALEDPALVDRIAADQVTLTVCPLSNLKLRVVDALTAHPMKRMLELGLKPTVNSDDPAYFGGYLAENYAAVAEAVGLTAADIATLVRNSFTGSFLSEEEMAPHLAEIDRLERALAT